ncbi:MAG: hypothetical protein WCP06_02045 [Verrucomicrobiota bacterium]
MKIVFITSCLEPGKDGVGDYTSALAQECVNQGHLCCLIALNDSFIANEPVRSAGVVPTLRMGRQQPWGERISVAQKMISESAPDRVSLQFVGYGFHPKGIVHGLAVRLRELIGDTPLHLMFHELWIGAQAGAPLKERLIGALQKHFILGLLRALPPFAVHTSNPAYRERLARCGVAAGILPLFGSVPIPSADCDNTWLWNELGKSGLSPVNREEFWYFGFFGTLHPVWPPEPLFSYLEQAGQIHGRKIALVAVGRLGSGEALWRSLVARYADRFTFCRLGERSPEQVGQVFRLLDYGIAASPWIIIGKSASAAALLEHGLPLIVNRDEVRYPFAIVDEGYSPLLCKMQPELVESLPELKRRPSELRLAAITAQFLREIAEG